MISIIRYIHKKQQELSRDIQASSERTSFYEELIVYGENKYSAFNEGIRIAKGEYVLFLDQNDRIEQKQLDNLCDILKTNDQDLFVFNFIFEYNDGYQEYNKVNTYHANAQILMEAYVFNSYDAFLFNKVFKMEIIKKNNLFFDEGIMIFAERLFCVKFLKFSDNIFYYDYPFLIRALNEKRHIGKLIPSINKETLPAYTLYIDKLKTLLNVSYENKIDAYNYWKKRMFIREGLIRARDFNYFIKTPISFIWKGGDSLAFKVKATIVSVINNIGIRL